MTHSQSIWKGTGSLYFWCLLTCFLWATNYVATRLGLDEFPPLTLSGLRYVIAALVLLPAIGFSSELRSKARNAPVWPILFYGLLQTAGAFGFLTASMTLIAPGRASIINNTHPFYTLVLAGVLLHERITRWKILSLALGFAGALFVLLPRLGGAVTSASGNLLALCAALCFSMANTYGRKISRYYDTRVLTAGQMLAGGLVLLVLAVVFEHPDLGRVSFHGWIAVLYLAVFGSLLPYLIWTHLLKYHEASRLSLFVFSLPVMASVLSFIIFGERFSSSTLMGLGLIAGGLFLIGRGR
jgi:O-acetylserine/cysteine efflux transporter